MFLPTSSIIRTNIQQCTRDVVASGYVTEGVSFDMNILPFKRCSKCGDWKLKSDFKKDKRSKDGYTSTCKVCHREDVRLYHKANLEKERVRKRGWVEANRERVREQDRNWRANNHGKRLESGRTWRENNPEKMRGFRQKWSDANPEKIRQYSRNRIARKKNAAGSFTVAEWRALKEFYSYTCLDCGRREPEIKLSPDHVLPLAVGGADSIDNIQPLCGSCNSRKGKKHIDYR